MHLCLFYLEKGINFVCNKQNNALMDFYLIIKERRLLLGLTQQDLADYSGLSLRIVKSIENGKGNPSIGTLKKITEILGLEIMMKVKEVNK